jgi:hypothetical protein
MEKQLVFASSPARSWSRAIGKLPAQAACRAVRTRAQRVLLARHNTPPGSRLRLTAGRPGSIARPWLFRRASAVAGSTLVSCQRAEGYSVHCGKPDSGFRSRLSPTHRQSFITSGRGDHRIGLPGVFARPIRIATRSAVRQTLLRCQLRYLSLVRNTIG